MKSCSFCTQPKKEFAEEVSVARICHGCVKRISRISQTHDGGLKRILRSKTRSPSKKWLEEARKILSEASVDWTVTRTGAVFVFLRRGHERVQVSWDGESIPRPSWYARWDSTFYREWWRLEGEAKAAAPKDQSRGPESENTRLNAFKVLGLSDGASPDEIRRAYRNLVFKLHPDKNPLPDASKRFQEVVEAYRTVS